MCVLYFGWPNQPSSGTMKILHWNVIFLLEIFFRDFCNTGITKISNKKITFQCKIFIVPEEGWFGQPKYSTHIKTFLRCTGFCLYFLHLKIIDCSPAGKVSFLWNTIADKRFMLININTTCVFQNIISWFLWTSWLQLSPRIASTYPSSFMRRRAFRWLIYLSTTLDYLQLQ